MDAIKASIAALLGGDAAPVALTTASLGVAFHVFFLRTLQVEDFMYNLIGSGLVTVATLLVAHLSLGFSVFSAGLRVWLLATSFNGAVLLSMVVYRVFFHRLNQFPGPFPAKVTRFYSAYKVSQSLRYFEIVSGWKEKYGDFVRTGGSILYILTLLVTQAGKLLNKLHRSPRDRRFSQVSRGSDLRPRLKVPQGDLVWAGRHGPEELIDSHDEGL